MRNESVVLFSCEDGEEEEEGEGGVLVMEREKRVLRKGKRWRVETLAIHLEVELLRLKG